MTHIGSCLNQLCLVSHDMADKLLTVITYVDSFPNQFCLMISTRIGLVNHHIAQ
jgi:hypothetical protein